MSPAEEFAAFWAVYPRHVAKLAAEKAFKHARQKASFQELVNGVALYIRGKPAYADWCHPATWLNAGRWLDEYGTLKPAPRVYWADECQELHGGGCPNHWNHEWRKREEQPE